MTASDTLGRKSCAIGDFSCRVIDCGHLRVLVDGGGAAPELSPPAGAEIPPRVTHIRCCRLGGFNAASPASLVLADLRVGSGGGAGGVGTVDGGCGAAGADRGIPLQPADQWRSASGWHRCGCR
jgi:hypothetical protein